MAFFPKKNASGTMLSRINERSYLAVIGARGVYYRPCSTVSREALPRGGNDWVCRGDIQTAFEIQSLLPEKVSFGFVIVYFFTNVLILMVT